jgi:uroporphyrinogen-III synthase
MSSPLDGVSVVVTRERRGELAQLLEAQGATVIHVPLIAVVEPDDGGAALAERLDRLDRYDWLVVSSPAGAERVGAAVAANRALRTAAVGSTTASVLARLAGRAVDLVPQRQTAHDLVAAFADAVDSPQRMCAALGDRAGPDLVGGLRTLGHDVDVVTAYKTVPVEIDDAARERIAVADGMLFASGSAVDTWVNAAGSQLAELTPPITVGIGPTTSRRAEESGLKLCRIAADHSLMGLVDELVACVAERSK